MEQRTTETVVSNNRGNNGVDSASNSRVDSASNSGISKNNIAKRENALVFILAIVLCYLTYHFIIGQLPGLYADYNGHTYVYLPMFTRETFLQGWKTVPYCMWHLGVLFMNKVLNIPIQVSAAYMSCYLALLSYFVVYWIICKFTASLGSEESPAKTALLSFGFCVMQSLYFPWLDASIDHFLGIYSMTPMHNPTQMAVRAFSLLCFCLVYDIWRAQKDEGYRGVFFKVETGLKKYYIYLAIFLLLSTFAKPTFAEMFIPAVGFIMLGEWIARICRKDGSAPAYFKHCLNMLLCAVPALGYILLQFLAYFIWGGSYDGGGGLIITKWLEVWGMYSENVALSILLGLSMPILLLLVDGKFFWKNEMGRLALVGYGIAFLEAAFLGEGGSKLSHSDFIWPIMSAMLLLWTISLLRLLELERTQADTKGKRFVINVAWFLFWLHAFYGLLYIKTSIV